MDLLYATNPGSQDLRWGTPLGGGLTAVIPLGFAGHRIVAMPGQRYLYVTGNKIVNGDIHAWLAVVDTCNNTVLAPEVDLGIGFAGQCAVPDSVGGNRAYVAISQAVGDRVLQGADSRIEVLNVLNPAAPVRLPGAITPSTQSSPYGFLHIVWSYTLNTLYASHRGDNQVYYFTPLGGQASLQSFSVGNVQPMGLGISNDGLVLFVARRLAGDLLEFDLTVQPPAQIGMPIPLPNADTGAGMFIAVASQDRVLVTSTRQQDGFLNIFQHERPQAATPQIQSIDTMGTRLGQSAVNPDSTVVYVPRGDQNDIAQVDLPNATLFPGFLVSGSFPSDAVVLRHEAGMTLQATPASIVASCGAPTDVEVKAFDSCGQELIGVPILASTVANNVSVSPQGAQPTPATFSVNCGQGGPATVNFTANVFPFVTLGLNVQCNCPQLYCYDFTTFAGGPLPQNPGNLGGVIAVETALQIQPNGPAIAGSVLRMFQGAVRFQVPPGNSVGQLTIRVRRQDPFPPMEQVHVTYTGPDGQPLVTVVPGPGVGRPPSPPGAPVIAFWDFDIVCPFTGITEWTIFGGQETLIREICFWA